ncbi:MAG: hypothetical protein KF872_07070 [Chitinophagales bacterium]|nr:hypothetical protein [Chitinophagales bacterium]
MAKRKPKKEKSIEKLSEENDFLKLKMMAEFGGEFISDTPVPPEVENIFLKQIQKIQRAHAQAETMSIHKMLGEPDFPPIKDLGKKDLKKQLKLLLSTLKKHNISVNHYPTVAPEELYRFITEELFPREVEKMKLKGWQLQFNYEDFYPNHEMDVAIVVNDALSLLIEKEPVPMEYLFDEDIKDQNGLQFDFEDFVLQLKDFHDTFIKAKIKDVHSEELSITEETGTAYERLAVLTSMQLEKGKRMVTRALEVEFWLQHNKETRQWLINRIRYDFMWA